MRSPPESSAEILPSATLGDSLSHGSRLLLAGSLFHGRL
jgi:hypothetical protein